MNPEMGVCKGLAWRVNSSIPVRGYPHFPRGAARPPVAGQLVAIPTIGLLIGMPPVEPRNGVLKANNPPSEATSQ